MTDFNWGNFLSNYGGDIVAGLGDAYSAYNAGNSRNQYADAVRNYIQQDYNDQKAQYEYDQQYNQQVAAASAANRAAARQAAVARAAAAVQTEANRQAAAKKAKKHMDSTYKNVQGLLKPSVDIYNALMPQMQNTYSGAANTVDLMRAYLMSPQQQAQMNLPVSASQVGMALPKYMQGSK